MKKTLRQRGLSLLLVLAMCLTLAPAAWAADTVTIEGEGLANGYLEPRDTAMLTLWVNGVAETNVQWDSDDEDVAIVGYDTGKVEAVSAGEATITAYYGANSTKTIKIEVSGIAVKGGDGYNPVVINENGASYTLTDAVDLFGAAKNASRGLTFTSMAPHIAEVKGQQITGKLEGSTDVEAEVTVSGNGIRYYTTIKVQVDPDKSTRIPETGRITVQGGKNKPFKELSSNFKSQLGGKVEYVTGIYVPTDKGTLYYGYNSDAEPGAGVGQVESYYLSPGPGQRDLTDITFVPKPGFVGGDVTISYSAVTAEGRTYSCKIELKVEGGGSSGSGSQTSGINLTTAYNTAVQFDSIEFGAVFREKGTQLDYVIFSQPPERQGTLYTNYSSSGSYGSVVDVHRQYSRKEIDDVWFVPAPGYRGDVTVYYTGYATNGKSYPGQVLIQVGQDSNEASSSGLLSYDVAPGGVARFDDWDFDNYCATLLDDADQTLSAIRFESLPSESEGVLYYDYQSSSNTGSRATVGTIYYNGTRAPRIDRLVFVPAENFIGGLKIPFTGWTMDGTSFSGNVEINVRSGAVSGDIYYYCAPGGTVSFRSSDFTSLSNTMTGRTLNYILLRNLPSTGTLYYGSTRASTGTRYSNSNLSRLSFRAPSSFSGPVNISFEGVSTGGDTFTGVITIGTSSGGGSSSRGNIRYTTDSKTAAVFYREDFDDLSLWETDRYISSVRFDLPSSSQGSLYRNYRSSSSMGTKIMSGTSIASSTSISASELNQVAFVPASGYTGTVYIGFTATTSGGGGTFTGEVVITVVSSGGGSTYFNDMAGYSSTQQAAVDFLYERGIANGVGDGRYGPESSIRRGDFAVMVYNAFGLDAASSGAFVDISPIAYYADAVNALYARGIVSGVGDGRYAPDSTLTRQDAVCMVQRAMRAVGRDAVDGNASALAGYYDGGSVSGYAQGAMALAVQRGYLPTTGGWLSPQQPLTRVDMAEILYRVFNY